MTIRVLHIDDDARFAELVASYLSQNGMLVSHAPDGGRAVRLATGWVDGVASCWQPGVSFSGPEEKLVKPPGKQSCAACLS